MKKIICLTLALSCAAFLTACPSPNNEAAVLLEESNALGDNANDDIEEYAVTLGGFESGGAPVSVVNAVFSCAECYLRRLQCQTNIALAGLEQRQRSLGGYVFFEHHNRSFDIPTSLA